jgi:hypothetical protein
MAFKVSTAIAPAKFILAALLDIASVQGAVSMFIPVMKVLQNICGQGEARPAVIWKAGSNSSGEEVKGVHSELAHIVFRLKVAIKKTSTPLRQRWKEFRDP